MASVLKTSQEFQMLSRPLILSRLRNSIFRNVFSFTRLHKSVQECFSSVLVICHGNSHNPSLGLLFDNLRSPFSQSEVPILYICLESQSDIIFKRSQEFHYLWSTSKYLKIPQSTSKYLEVHQDTWRVWCFWWIWWFWWRGQIWWI